MPEQILEKKNIDEFLLHKFNNNPILFKEALISSLTEQLKCVCNENNSLKERITELESLQKGIYNV